MQNNIAVKLQDITKTFGKQVVANKDVTLDIRKGEILSLLGENGSGKTTLMNMLAGIYFPDSGHIFMDTDGEGLKEVSICSPKDAYALGIGMIHQHFKLVDVLPLPKMLLSVLIRASRSTKSKLLKILRLSVISTALRWKLIKRFTI